MKPLCRLTDAEASHFGEMTPGDFEQAGVPKWLVPHVWGVAQNLMKARLCRSTFQSNRSEATVLGERASWGNRGARCGALNYLVRNVRKAVVRENKSARNRPTRPSRDNWRAHCHDPDEKARDLFPIGTLERRVAAHVLLEDGETIDEYGVRVASIAANM